MISKDRLILSTIDSLDNWADCWEIKLWSMKN
jgi:hypothetical protein